MNAKLYAFGGIVSGHIQSDVIESYDFEENQWSYVGNDATSLCGRLAWSSMRRPFISWEDVAVVGKFNNCFKYVPETREWSELRGMRTGRFNFGAVVLECQDICVWRPKIRRVRGQFLHARSFGLGRDLRYRG